MAIPETRLTVELTLIEEALGMMPSNPNVREEYIISRAPDAKTIAEEIEDMGVEEVIEKGITIFPRDENGVPYMYDYQLRGMFKDSFGLLRRVNGSEASKVKNYKKAVDGQIFIAERKVRFAVSGEMGECQRPLRTQTPHGEQSALAHSETIPAGSTLTFTIVLYDSKPSLKPAVEEVLDYGARHGMCQWRNSGKGAFTWRKIGDWEDNDSMKAMKASAKKGAA